MGLNQNKEIIRSCSQFIQFISLWTLQKEQLNLNSKPNQETQIRSGFEWTKRLQWNWIEYGIILFERSLSTLTVLNMYLIRHLVLLLFLVSLNFTKDGSRISLG